MTSGPVKPRRSSDAKSRPSSDAKSRPPSDAKSRPTSDAKLRSTSETKARPSSETKPRPPSDAKPRPTSDAKSRPTSDAKSRPPSNAKHAPSPASPSARRLPKAERREQLLDTAHDILQAEGPQALTLGYLAERAGVTKPITYEHFKTRPGLLIALARQIDDRQIEVLRDAVTHAPPRLDRVARVLGTAYMHCYTTVGPQWQAISAALRSESEMDAVQQEMLDRYVLIYRDALAPFSRLAPSELHLRCVAIIGAAEALARAMLVGRIDEAAAAAALGSLIIAWLNERRTSP